jgi:hypothetical protein
MYFPFSELYWPVLVETWLRPGRKFVVLAHCFRIISDSGETMGPNP